MGTGHISYIEKIYHENGIAHGSLKAIVYSYAFDMALKVGLDIMS